MQAALAAGLAQYGGDPPLEIKTATRLENTHRETHYYY